MKQKYSPMMMQYLGIKEQNKDAIKGANLNKKINNI